MQTITALTAAAEAVRVVAQVELQFSSAFGLNLSEAMTLCAVAGEQLPATAVSDRTHLRPSSGGFHSEILSCGKVSIV